MNYREIVVCLTAGAVFWNVNSVSANVKMPFIFGDHMVLQQGMDLPVWGTADTGEKVTVTVGKENGSATAGTDGKWMVKLAPLPYETTPVTMTVTGKNSLKFEDVLIGDVWVCSGQSNMTLGLAGTHNGKEEMAKANLPLLRIFNVPQETAETPLDDLRPIPHYYPVLSHWRVCSPDTVANVGGTWGGFSAVAYYFGREIQKNTGQPVGLIHSSFPGTPGEAWTSLSGLQKDPALKNYVDAADQIRANYTQASADYPAKQAAYKADLAKWNKDIGTPYNATLKEWSASAAAAQAAGKRPPPKPWPSVLAPKPPLEPDGGSNAPTTLFNGMIAPLIPYGLKGVAWYQGENNTLPIAAAKEYQTLFGRLITDWREKWGQGDFPFLFVQLTGVKLHGPMASGWLLVREAQLKTLALPNTGMAITFDIGDPTNIHAPDKLDVGLRLALAATHVAYGQDLVYSGPIYDKMQLEGGAVRLSFTQVGGGLIIGTSPWASPGVILPPNTTLVGFDIAGQDKKWVPADAKIDGNTVVVSSPQVPNPVAVRYAWAGWPPLGANLYNKENLPASPFRTDDWDDASDQPAAPPATSSAIANPKPPPVPNATN